MNRNYLIALSILSGLLVITAESAGTSEATQSFAPHSLYAVNESSKDRGSISVYDIDAGYRLIKTVQTVPGDLFARLIICVSCLLIRERPAQVNGRCWPLACRIPTFL